MSCASFRDGVPYCERDYQIQFGVKCEACQKFITGKLLEVREVGFQRRVFVYFSVAVHFITNISLRSPSEI